MADLDVVLALGKPVWSALQESFLRQIRSPLVRDDHLYWLYLLSSALIALAIHASARRSSKTDDRHGSEGVRGFLRFCFPRSIWSQPSAWLDLRYFFIHTTIQRALLPLLQFGSALSLAYATRAWIMGRYGTPPLWEWRDSTFGALLATLILAALIDFVTYVVHVLQHKIPFLWEFHKVHHSASALHPLSNYREHPVDNIVYQSAVGVSNGIGLGLILCLFDKQPVLNILGVDFVAFMYNLVGYNLRHSHIWLAWPPVIGRILASPANHQIHHSAEARHLDRNFGFIFVLWDWIFGTLYLPRERETFRMGLYDGTGSEYSSTLRLYFLPFVKVFRSMTGRSRKVSV